MYKVELRMGRVTVRKIIRSGVTEFKYERKSQPYRKLGPWRERLDKILDPSWHLWCQN